MGNGLTFRRNLVGLEDVRVGVGYLADEVAARLRRHGLKCTALQVNIKDPALKTISRQKQLEAETDLSRELAEAAVALVTANWDLRQPIRAITVTAMGLTDEATPRQTSLFGEPGQDPRHRRRARLEQALDGLRDRFGPDAVAAAGVLGSDLGLMENKARPRAEEEEPDP